MEDYEVVAIIMGGEKEDAKMFAKLFGTDKDQVLVKIDANKEGIPEIRVYCQPEDHGVCDCAITMSDNSDKSWDNAEKAFAEINEAYARKMVEVVFRSIGLTVPDKSVE